MQHVTVNDKTINADKGYAARGVVGRFDQIGHVGAGLIRTPIYRYLSFDAGEGQSFAAVYVGQAPVKDGELDINALPVGAIVVNPGLVYRRVPWTSSLMSGHLRAMRGYRPKTIVTRDAEMDAPIDLGALNTPTKH